MFGWFGSDNKEDIKDKEAKIAEYTPEALDVLLEHFQEITGMDFNHKKDVILGKLKLFCRDTECFSFEDLLKDSKKDENVKRDLINFLTINETYFNRELPQIKALPSMIKEDSKKVEILSMPCSTGEEVYSIIIELYENGLREDKFNITGLDIDSDVLAKAKKAHFSQRSLHRVPKEIISKYFTKEDDVFLFNSSMKQIPSFKLNSIFELNTSKKYDYIFCRNLLIYFDEETKIKAIRSLVSVLNENGKIFFGHSDHVDEVINLHVHYAYGTKFYQEQ